MKKDILQLCRPRLSAMVAASALAGRVLQPSPAGYPLWPALGVFLLAGGASALNQVQEREIDGRMARTCRRPLPAGRVQPRAALLIAILLLAAGLAALAVSGTVPFLFGLLAVVCYNGIYTPLKRKTAFAILPGALCGALPPVIGWTAGGGHPADFRSVLLAGLLFLWQMPHFWLFAEKHRDDYRRAGLPVLGDLFAAGQCRRLIFIWTAALTAATLALPAYGLIVLPPAQTALLVIVLFPISIVLAAVRHADSTPVPLSRSLTAGLAGIIAALLLQGYCQ